MQKHHRGTDLKEKKAVNKHREKKSQEPLQLKKMGAGVGQITNTQHRRPKIFLK